MIHRQVLASHTLPAPLLLVMDDVIKMVSNIKASPLNHRIFQQLCKEMGSDYEALLYYSHVRWLSRGKVLQRFYILRQAIADNKNYTSTLIHIKLRIVHIKLRIKMTLLL